MKLKVCGMRETENIEALAALTPDYMGFIFWAPSSRFVEGTTPTLPQHIKKTGVFVDATIDYIETIIKEHQLQAVQLHGKETPEYCSYVQSLDVEVIKAFSIKDHFDFTSLAPYENCCDFYLLDFPVATAMVLTGVFLRAIRPQNLFSLAEELVSNIRSK
jgi:phosphoribosylanthranilate isomerase